MIGRIFERKKKESEQAVSRRTKGQNRSAKESQNGTKQERVKGGEISSYRA
jgi:hypothetical protein